LRISRTLVGTPSKNRALIGCLKGQGAGTSFPVDCIQKNWGLWTPPDGVLMPLTIIVDRMRAKMVSCEELSKNTDRIRWEVNLQQ
jgi:hypothetical protein